jgi:lipopolysaccharide/colanic/teichoic acid biosynthesis glycosyltransferase
MSLVGPRPTIPYEVEQYPPSWFARFAVRPGMTGLWQVSGRSKLTYEQMIRLDIEYARSRSLWVNLKILARTIPTVLFARDAA